MRSIASRAAALLLALALAASALPFAALAAGPLTYTVRTDLGQGLTLTQGNGYTDAGKLRQLFTLDYTPGGNVRPLVLYGTYINGKSPVGTVVAYAESMGYRVLAAVNSDFFFMGSGVPTGMTIQNGRLASSDGGWNAVGFFEDGTAIAGTPKLSITLTGPDGAERPIHALNNVRTSAGIYLYTQDFDATTATTAAGTEVVLEPVKGDPLRLGRKLKARVVSTAHAHRPGSAGAQPDGQLHRRRDPLRPGGGRSGDDLCRHGGPRLERCGLGLRRRKYAGEKRPAHLRRHRRGGAPDGFGHPGGRLRADSGM